jgi:sterol desaturase/sphingolipid hydroxylase (fatty acid hydroxylase superfamily)
MKKSLAFLAVVFALSILGYAVGVYALCEIVRHFPAVGPFVFIDSHGGSEFGLKGTLLQPMAFMATMAICLSFDLLLLGMDQSSLKRLLDCATESSKVDRFYVILRLAGGINVLVFLFSFGTLFWVVNRVHHFCHGIAVLEHVHSYVMQFLIVCLINTLIGYWAHRLMHTKWMWEIHKVHHAAEEMNLVTTFRNHPVEQMIMTILYAAPVALLGAPKPVIMVYTAFNLIYGAMAHSEIVLRSKVWDLILITPAAHRIHHSDRKEHFDRNFGILTIWDWLFGTYYAPTAEKLTYGVEDGAILNRPQHVREVFDNVGRWLRPLGRRLRATRPVQPPPADPMKPPAGSAVRSKTA